MKELQAALKGFTQKNETLKLETKVRLHEILVTFTLFYATCSTGELCCGEVPRESFNGNNIQ